MAEGQTPPRQILRDRLPLLVVAGLAFAASLTSLPNGFAYDDVQLVVNNGAAHQLLTAPHRFLETYWPEVPLVGPGRLYRPLTVIGFAVQWVVGQGRPLVFHLVSVLGYALVAVLVYLLARRFLSEGRAALAGALFAVHPVHVEAVANVVGQGELWTAGFMLAGALAYVDARREGYTHHRRGVIAACYLAACLTKETGAIFPLLLLALEPVLPRVSWREKGRLLLPLALVAVAWLAVRTAVTGSLGGEEAHAAWVGLAWPFRALTMLGVVSLWGRLLVWPAALSADYSPQEIMVASGIGPAQFAGTCVLLFVAYLALRFRRLAPLTLTGLAWMAAALLPVANLAAPTGIIAAERTLFLPSVGFVLVVGALAELWAAERSDAARMAAGAAILVLLALGIGRSATRAPVWRDSRTLYAQTLLDAPRSYWAWRNYAGQMVLDDREADARGAYAYAITLFDRDPQVYDDRGSFERRTGHCERAVIQYQLALGLAPGRDMTAARLVGCLSTLRRFDEARAVAQERLRRGRTEFETLLVLVDSAEARAHLHDSTPTPLSPVLPRQP